MKRANRHNYCYYFSFSNIGIVILLLLFNRDIFLHSLWCHTLLDKNIFLNLIGTTHNIALSSASYQCQLPTSYNVIANAMCFALTLSFIWQCSQRKFTPGCVELNVGKIIISYTNDFSQTTKTFKI